MSPPSGNERATHEDSASSRALRALRVSGRRLMPRGGGWAVIGPDARRRPFALVREAEALALVAAGLVIATAGGGYVLSDAGRTRDAQSLYAGPFAGGVAGLGPMLAQQAAGQTACVRRADFSGLVVLARNGQGPLSLRAALAGLRIAREAESASRRGGLTMNWSATPMDRGRRRARDGGLNANAREAAQRLEMIAAATPEPGFALVQAACVEGARLRALEARFALRRGQAGGVLARLLEYAADAFDRMG